MKVRHVVAVLAALLLPTTAAFGQQKDTSYLTEIPKVAPSRWMKKPPPVRKIGKVTRDDYLKYIQEKWMYIRPAALNNLKRDDVSDNYRHARREAFVYHITKRKKHAQIALKFLQNHYLFRTRGRGADFSKAQSHVGSIIPAFQAYQLIRDSGVLEKKDHEKIREMLRLEVDNYAYYECGAMNRGIGGSLSVMILNHFYPETAEEPLKSNRALAWHKDKHFTKKQYVKYVWNHWWPFRDFVEDSSGYNSLTLDYIIDALELVDKEDLLQDAAMKELAERYLMQVAPTGAMPGYGDAMGYNTDPGRWIAILEKWATVYKDGRFKWVAHRMFEFIRLHEKTYYQWGNPVFDIMDDLIDAYLCAEESIEPVEPTVASLVTYRKDFKWLDQRTQGRSSELLDKTIPNKLVFRTGWRPGDTYAFVDLCPPMAHDQADTAAINFMCSGDSVLLGDTPYLIKAHQFHNSFMVWPDTRYSTDPRRKKWNWGYDVQRGTKSDTSVPAFHAGKRAAFAHIRVTDYLNGRTDLDRRIFFLGEHGLWVRDTLGSRDGFKGKIGPAFQFTGLHPVKGTHWAVGCQTTVPVANITAHAFAMQFRNRPTDLLVWYAPKRQARLTLDDVRMDTTRWIVPTQDFLNNMTDRVWYHKAVQLKGPKRETFSTVLLPHAPMADPARLAKGISSVVDADEGRAAVKITTPGGATLWVGINEKGRPLTAGPVATDAKSFLVRQDAGRTLTYWLVEATSLKVDGKEVFAAPKRETVDTL